MAKQPQAPARTPIVYTGPKLDGTTLTVNDVKYIAHQNGGNSPSSELFSKPVPASVWNAVFAGNGTPGDDYDGTPPQDDVVEAMASYSDFAAAKDAAAKGGGQRAGKNPKSNPKK